MLLQEWEEQINAAAGEAEMYEARAGRALLQVNGIRSAVTGLFEAANCEITAAQEVLKTGPVGPANLIQYLGIVEQRVDQTLRVSNLPKHASMAAMRSCMTLASAAESCSYLKIGAFKKALFNSAHS